MEEFEIKGKRRGFKLGTYTFKLINQATGTKTIQDVFSRVQDKDEDFMLSFYFCCAKHFALSNKLPVDFEEVDVADWIDEIGGEKLTEISLNLFKTHFSKNQMAPTMGPEAQ